MKYLLIVIGSILAAFCPLHAQFLSKQWAEIDSAIQKDLPVQAQTLLRTLQAEAMRSDATAHVMAAALTRMQLATELSPDSAELAWDEFQAYAAQERRPEQRTLWQVALAKVMAQSYENNKQQEAKTLFLKLLEQGEALHRIKTQDYALLFNEQPSSILYANDLLHVVLREVLQSHLFTQEECRKICDEYVAFYRTRGMHAAALLLALRYGDAKTLAQDYAAVPEAVEAYIKQVQELPLSTNKEIAEAIRMAEEGIQRYPNQPRTAWLKHFMEQRQLPSVFIAMNDASSLAYPNRPLTLKVQATNIRTLKMVCRKANAPSTTTTQTLTLPQREAWYQTDTTWTFTLPDPGRYVCTFYADGDSINQRELSLSRLRPMVLKAGDEPCRVMAVDAMNGAPIKDFALVAYDNDEQTLATYRPNLQGEVWIKNHPLRMGQFAVVTQGDSCSPTFRLPTSYTEINETPKSIKTSLFTDRAIYRPNQRVRFAGVVYDQQGDILQTLAHHNFKVQACDVQGTVFAEIAVETDENGDFIGEFKIPETLQPGSCALRTATNERTPGLYLNHFTVEEYKRATFQVAVAPQQQAYTAGDTLTISGHALTYTNLPLSGARVNYRILNNRRFLRQGTANDTIDTGTCLTHADGHFSFPFAVPALPEPTSVWRRQTYVIEVDVVAAHGEMQQTTQHITVAPRAAHLNMDMPQSVKREKLPQIKMTLRNTSGVVLQAPISYKIFAKHEPQITGTLTSPAYLPHNVLEQLPDGQYRIAIYAAGTDSVEQAFMMWSDKTKRLPDHQDFFYHTERSAQGDSVRVYVGTSHDDITLFYDEINDSGAVVRTERFTLSDTLMRFDLAYHKERGMGFVGSWATMIQGTLHDRQEQVYAPKPDKRLELKWETFRNYLMPGATEQWRLKVTTPDGRPAAASVLATLYDASLDDLQQHQWQLPLHFERRLPMAFTTTGYAQSLNLRYRKLWEGEAAPELRFTHWHNKWFSYYASRETIRVKSNGAMLFAAKRESASTDMVLREVVVRGQSQPEQQQVVRSNFAETAFFDWLQAPRGEAQMSVTLPQSLTQWRLLLLAHDTAMNHALRIDTIAVHQDFMLQCAMPRFAYEGDVLHIPLTLTNQSSEAQCGNIEVCFNHPNTRSEVKPMTLPFEVAAHKSVVLQATVEVPQGWTQLACTATASTGSFSDGEYHVVPVKSQRVMTEQSVAFSLNQAGTSRINIKKLWPKTTELSKVALSINITPNALHEALTALHQLAAHNGRSSDGYAQRFYAASLALWVLQQQGETPDSVVANLNTARQEALLMLHRLMTTDGEWAWYDGMRPSFAVSTDIAMLLARLYRRTADAEAKNLLDKVVPALQRRVAERVKEMRLAISKRPDSTPYIGADLMRYLCLYPLLELTIDDDAQYLINHAPKMNKALSMYDKATMSNVLRYAGKTAEADLLLQSVREHMVCTPEMGMYFDSYRAEMSRESYRQETQVAAVEAFAGAKQQDVVEPMLQWLLQSKRTQQWSTNRVTADVVYALLFLSGEPKSVGRNDHVVQTTFYKKKTPLSAGRLLDEPYAATHLEVEKLDNSLTWGSVTARYELPQSEVEHYENGLAIAQYFEVEEQGQWMTFKSGTALKVGQRVRRTLKIKADRDYDFVEVRAARAAALQPYAPHSGFDAKASLPAYRAVKDDATEYYIEKMPKGKHRFTEILTVDRLGAYHMGVCKVQCVHAPEFAGHTDGDVRLEVKP